MDENEEKQQMREVYRFENDTAFEYFYEGMKASLAGKTQNSIESFAHVVELEPDNPVGYNFLVMSLEFDENSTEADRLKWVEQWVKVSEAYGNGTQIMRSNMVLKFYKSTPEERERWLKHGTKNATD